MKFRQWETVYVAGTVERIEQTIVCILSAVVVAVAAVGLANSLHAGLWLMAAACLFALVAGFILFFGWVIKWGESRRGGK